MSYFNLKKILAEMVILEIEKANELSKAIFNQNTIQLDQTNYKLDILVSNFRESQDYVFILGNKIRNFMKGTLVLAKYEKRNIPASSSICFQKSDYHHMDISKDRILIALDHTWIFNHDLELLYFMDKGEYYFYKDGFLLLNGPKLSFYSVQDQPNNNYTNSEMNKTIELKGLKSNKIQSRKYNEKLVNGEIRVQDDLILTKEKILFESDTRELVYFLKDLELQNYLDFNLKIDPETITKIYQYQYYAKKEKDIIDLEILQKCGNQFIQSEIKSSAKSISSIKKLLNFGLKQLSLEDTIDQILNENYEDLYKEMNNQLDLQILLDRLSVFEEIFIKTFIDIEKEYQLFLDFDTYTKRLAATNNEIIFKLLPFCDYSILEYFPLFMNILFTPKSKKEYYFKIFLEDSDFMEENIDTSPILARIQELRTAGLFVNAVNMIDYYLQDVKLSSMVQSPFSIDQIQNMSNQGLIENCENIQILKILDPLEQMEFVKINIEKGNSRIFIGSEMFDYLLDYFNKNDVDVDINEWDDILNDNIPATKEENGWELELNDNEGWDIDDELEEIQESTRVKEMREKLGILQFFHSFGIDLNFYRLKSKFVLPIVDQVPLDSQTIRQLLMANEIIKMDLNELAKCLFKRALQEKKFNLIEIIPLSNDMKAEIKLQVAKEWFNKDQAGNKYKGYFKDILALEPPNEVVDLIEITHELIHNYHLKVTPKELCANPHKYLNLVIAENDLYNDLHLVAEMSKKLGLNLNIVDVCAKISMQKKDFVVAYQLLKDTQSELVGELILNDEFEDSHAKLLLACNQDDMQLFNHVEQFVYAFETNNMHDFYNSVGSPIHNDYTEPHITLDIKIAQLLESQDFEYEVEFFDHLPKTPENINLASYFFNLKAYITTSTPFNLNSGPFPGENKYKRQSLLYQSKIKSVESKQLLDSLGLAEKNLHDQLVDASRTLNDKVFAKVMRIAKEYQIDIDPIVKARVHYLISIPDVQPLKNMLDLVQYFPEIDIHEPNEILLGYYQLTNTHLDMVQMLENLKEKDLEIPLHIIIQAKKQPELFTDIFSDYCKFLSIKDFIALFNEWIDPTTLLECVKIYIDNIPWITFDKDTAIYIVQELIGINDLEISEYLFFKTFPDIIINSFKIKPELQSHYELLVQSNEKYHELINQLYKQNKTPVFIQMIQDDHIPDVEIDDEIYRKAIQLLVETRQFDKLQVVHAKYFELIKEIMKTQPSDIKLVLLDLLSINDETERLVSLAKTVWDLDLEGETKEAIVNSMIENTSTVSQAIQLLQITDYPKFIEKITELEFDTILLHLSLKKQIDYTIKGFHRYFYGIYTNDKSIIKEFVLIPMHKEHKLLYQLLIIQGYFGFETEILEMIDGPFEYVLGCILLTKCDYKIKILKRLRNIPDGMFNGCDWQRILKIVIQSCIDGWNFVAVDEAQYLQSDFYGAILNNCLAKSNWLEEFYKMIK
ncbi:hypothetical protein HDV06_001172 [Boothiomyces sp. JEL0866]|nr:hypothetical protein HDV06_001172 [Boothiomyces sp. JEL0866]